MLKKVYYTICKKDSIIKLQKTAERIFKVELEQFKAKSAKTLSDSHALCQEQVQSLKEACWTKNLMISTPLKTFEKLSSNKHYKTAIPLLQTTAVIMIPKSQIQRIHKWRHHSGTYYQQPLIQRKALIMQGRLTSYQAFQLRINHVRWDYKKMPSLDYKKVRLQKDDHQILVS